MKNRKLNILILGCNYYDEKVSSLRVKNLFDPILDRTNIILCNIVINSNAKINWMHKSKYVNLKYNIYNPFSIFYFLLAEIYCVIRKKDKKATNVIYHYGYPSIEDILMLKIGFLLGYKIVYDIVENINYVNQNKSSLRMKIKNWTSRLMIKQIYKNGKICFGISSLLCNYISEISKNKILVIHLPISVNVEYVNLFRKEKSELTNQSIKVFYGGSFGYKDGFEYLLKGFEIACENCSNIELILTGLISKEMEEKVQSLIRFSMFANRIKYLGCLPIDEYFNEMVNSDILCMCRINNEYANFGFPFKLGEYMASGNAIIATKVGDVSNYIVNGINALLISPESAVEISDAIQELVHNSKLRISLGQSAFDTSLKYFSSTKVSQILYDKLIRL